MLPTEAARLRTRQMFEESSVCRVRAGARVRVRVRVGARVRVRVGVSSADVRGELGLPC